MVAGATAEYERLHDGSQQQDSTQAAEERPNGSVRGESPNKSKRAGSLGPIKSDSVSPTRHPKPPEKRKAKHGRRESPQHQRPPQLGGKKFNPPGRHMRLPVVRGAQGEEVPCPYPPALSAPSAHTLRPHCALW